MKRNISIILFLLLNFVATSSQAQSKLTNYVNPFSGTGGHGHTYPGATMPHGMVQLSPDTRLTGWDGCSGYHYDDNFIYGFSHTHLSGTGVSDYGDILVMPMNGDPSPNNKIYGSNFIHKNETASPGFYSVKLDDDNIDVALTVTERVGLHKYHFNKTSQKNIIIDLLHRDEVLGSALTIENDHTISGYRRSNAWAKDQLIYFVIEFSRPIIKLGIWENEILQAPGKKFASGKNIKAFFQWGSSNEILVKVAVSGVSIEGARKNLKAEMPGWKFNAIKKSAEKIWEENLSSILVKGDESKKRIFYTALYHTAIVPNINMDVDSMYRGRDKEIHKATMFTNYSVFSLWDTYRATHPLYNIIDTQRSRDYINTMLVQYKQGGRLPVWELAANETDCMIGYHSVSVIADAYAKGVRGFDTALALEAMVSAAEAKHFGLEAYQNKGMIESDDENESVSRTLEYAYDDWCIASFAAAVGDLPVYNRYITRAQYYKNVLETKVGFMRPRKNGDWLSPFEPREVNNNYTEANAWQYSFYAPQDIGGYTKLIGGPVELEKKLDALFAAPSITTGRDQSDITGLIGQYAHGNEPSHHIAYLYNYAGQPGKTQEKVNYIMNNFYKDSPDGLIGNEDCGQMSAWYVMSAMGFYPVTPGSTEYAIGLPAFEEMKIKQGKGFFTITAKGISDTNKYVHHVNLYHGSGRIQLLKLFKFNHDFIKAGNELSFSMNATPKIFYDTDRPSFGSTINADSFLINPIIKGGPVPFRDTKSVDIINPNASGNLLLETDRSAIKDQNKSDGYKLMVDSTMELIVSVKNEHTESKKVFAKYVKAQNNWSIELSTLYEAMYDGGGTQGLIDGVPGEENWRKGNWQGYQVNDLDAVIDLGKIESHDSVQLSLLQDSRAWIVLPSSVSIYAGIEKDKLFKLGEINHNVAVSDLETKKYKLSFDLKKVPYRYIRVVAHQYGKMPSWSEGAGGDTHIFADEIIIK